MKRVSTKFAITAGFSAMLVILLILMGVWLFNVRDNSARLQDMANDLRKSELVFAMRDAAMQRALVLHRMAITEDIFERDDAYMEMSRKASGFIAARDELLEMDLTNAERTLWDNVRPFIANGSTVQAEAAQLLLDWETEAASRLLLESVIPTQNTVMTELTRMLDVKRDSTRAEIAAATHRNNLSYAIVITLGIIAVSLGAAIAVSVIRSTGRSTRALVEARESAQAANQLKSQFLANMSHEIRTPLTAIIGYADVLLESGELKKSQTNLVQPIERSGKHLLRVINDILDLSKIEAGEMKLEQIPVSPPEVLAGVESLMAVKAAEKDLRFRVRYETPVPESFQADPTRLKQILLNLCGNAIKFTKQGEVTITAAYDRKTQRIVFRVRDTGIGLTEKEIARIFNPFSQADASTTRKFGRTGLGLTIVKELAENMGGEISCVSEKGHGSEFALELPAESDVDMRLIDAAQARIKSADAVNAATTVPRLRGQVLLAEDSPDNQRLITMHLERAGATVTLATNGQEAVEHALVTDFDLILMDIQMPVLDGKAAASLLRNAGYASPIVALTANVMREDIEEYLGLGMNAVLAKPIEPEKFYPELTRHLADAGDTANEADDPLAADPKFQALVRDFVAGLPEMIDAVRGALGQRDWIELKGLAHKLKGMGGGFGYPQITDAAAALDAQVAAEEYATVPELAEKLVHVCRDAVANLEPVELADAASM